MLKGLGSFLPGIRMSSGYLKREYATWPGRNAVSQIRRATKTRTPRRRPGRSATGRVREKVGIWMPRAVRQRLRIHAAVLDREISEVIEQAVTEYLDRHDQQRATEGLPPIPLR